MAASPTRAATFADLKTDWSNSSNPNPGPFGTWSYTQGGAPLPFVSHWAGDGGNLSGWGPAANTGGDFLPFFFQTTTVYDDSRPGDCLVHTTDQANGGPNGPAIFIWTSGMDGTVTITGTLWPIRLIGRTNDYQLILVHNGDAAVLDSGQVVEDGGISRCFPIRFRIPQLAISSGDALKLQIIQDPQSAFGDFVGVNLSVSTGNCSDDPGDLNGDGKLDGQDIAHFVNCVLHGASPCADCACGDMDNSGATDLGDVSLFAAALL